jgi:hypothetical protein
MESFAQQNAAVTALPPKETASASGYARVLPRGFRARCENYDDLRSALRWRPSGRNATRRRLIRAPGQAAMLENHGVEILR